MYSRRPGYRGAVRSTWAGFRTAAVSCRSPPWWRQWATNLSFVLDVSHVWETRIEAVKCYRSQLYDPDSDGPATNIAAPDFLERLTARFRHYGSLVGVTYGEPYWMRGPVPVFDPLAPFDGGER